MSDLWNKSSEFQLVWKPWIRTILPFTILDPNKKFWFDIKSWNFGTSSTWGRKATSMNAYLNQKYRFWKQMQWFELWWLQTTLLGAPPMEKNQTDDLENKKLFKTISYTKQTRSIHYNISCRFQDIPLHLVWVQMAQDWAFMMLIFRKFNFYHNQKFPKNIKLMDSGPFMRWKTESLVWEPSGKDLTRYNLKTKTWKNLIHASKSTQKAEATAWWSLLGDKNGKLWS